MRRIVLVVNMLITTSLLAQQPKDKAVYSEPKSPFWDEIKKGIKEYQKTEEEPYRIFKLDPSTWNLPQSVDEFTNVWCNDPVSQGRTGTCWCFSTTSFYESEIFRLTKKKIKLSELYTVYWEYVEKAREYVRTRGASFFGEGSETNAVARMMKTHGIVPEESYTGMQQGQKFHDHLAMFNEMHNYLRSVRSNNAWNEDEVISTIKSILDHYIGKPPVSVLVAGKNMTPVEFMKNIAKLNPDDYVNFMSLMEKPYWTKAEYKVPDNWWRSNDYYNVPLDDFMAAIKNAVKKGYSISIGGDVSEPGYLSEYDVAVVPSFDIPSEYIDENARQLRFNNKSTTDDHAIHLVGYKEDKNGNTWFLIKDSGSGSRTGKNKGYYFFHEDYVKLKIMTFTIHKDAVIDLLKKMQ